MFFKKIFYRLCFTLLCVLISFIIGFILFKPIYIAKSVIIPYSLHPYDICLQYPVAWNKIKMYFILFYFLSTILCTNFIYSIISKKYISKFVKIKKKTMNSHSSNRKSFSIGR